MKILVTGGLGFIGSHLCDALAKEGHDLTILDDLSTGRRERAPKGAQVVIADASKPGAFDALVRDTDACYHLAAVASVERSHHEWLRTHQVNATATVNLFEAMARAGKYTPVVYASSAAIYGGLTETPMREDGPVLPTSAYGVDKYACEWHGYVASHIHHIVNIGLRFFNVYGPRQDPASPYSGVISIFAARLLKGEKITINGDGEQSRDFIFVGDVVRALQLAMQALQNKKTDYAVCNIGTGHGTTINILAETLAKAAGLKAMVEHGPARLGDARHSVGTLDRAKTILGFTAKVPLEDGLKETIGWLKSGV